MTFLFSIPSWAFMWLLALATYAIAKAATLLAGDTHDVPFSRRAAYLLLFPGMNAAAFCHPHPVRSVPAFPAPRFLANIFLGITLFWILARQIPPGHPLLQGWIGMIGLTLFLHFGVLQGVSLAWQTAGFNAPLLMNQPVRSISVADFWSARWNTAFRQLSHQFLFRPLARRTNPKTAMFLTFAFSGIVHDLIISLPAGAGFGLHTLYFLMQSMGLQFERSRIGRRLLSRPIAARLFAIAVVTLPAPLLFHPPFVRHVFLPFMVALHALPPEVLA